MPFVSTTDDIRPQGSAEETRLRDLGLRWGDRGTHTSRTIMLHELGVLLGSCRPDATRADYLSAMLEDNCLGKRTAANRKLSSKRLSELYALDHDVPLFRIMRRCWYAYPEGQPLLAMLLALARDPLLRASAPPVLQMQPGEELARQEMTDAVSLATGRRLNEGTLETAVRNVSSSWTQSGHLSGRRRKIRRSVRPTPAPTAFALLLGHVLGRRGMALFESFWARVLDAPASELVQIALDARRLGLLDMSQSGGVVEVSLQRLMAFGEG